MGSTASPSTSTWHTVNPQTRPLTLSILELTPLALTLSLTLAPLPSTSTSQQHHIATQHLAHTHNHAHGPARNRKKSRHRRPDSDDEATAVEVDEDGHHLTHLPGTYPHGSHLDLSTNFKDLLSHGVVVSVNGQPWNRIVAHVSDPEEEPEVDEGEQADNEEGDWEDDGAVLSGEGANEAAGAEEGIGGEGVTKRRPRKARFGSSAVNAVKTGEDKPLARRKSKSNAVAKAERVDRDRAVVVVYGLSPGKEYEIELQVVGLSSADGMDFVSNSILVPSSPSPMGGGMSRSRANSLRSRSQARSRSNSMNTAHPIHALGSAGHSNDSSAGASPGITPPVGGAAETHAAPIPTNILNPIDTQAAQIRHMIAAAHAEKEHVQTQIKEARRASQRAEAALRLEIETVKKSTDKAGSLDLRAKQKALALQEQVKQGWAGAENAEKEANAVEAGMTELDNKLQNAKIDVDTIKSEWKSTKEREEEIREKEKKSRLDEEKKLAEVTGKIEKIKARKDKKEADRAELEKKLEELEKQREETEKKAEEETNSRKSGAHWFDPYSHGNHGHHHGHGHNDHGRTLTNHPSLNNLSGHGGYNGPGFRGRGFGGRYPSAGSVRPPAAQPSPTHAGGFHPLQHPVPPSAATSPAFRPPKLNNIGSPATPGRSGLASGVNVSALPFHPANLHNNATAGTATDQHTTLMPPQLQHRIYLPNVRPRPAPNFNPPPSVIAEQAQRSSPTTLSTPSFPPLPGQSPSISSANAHKAPGPSLASIVTRAVLSPTSALATQGISPNPSAPGGRPSPPLSGPVRSSSYGPASPHSSSSTPSQSAAGSGTTSRQVTFGPPPNERTGEFPPLSPTGPWANLGAALGGSNLVRTSTPPVMSGWGRESPVGQIGEERKRFTAESG